MTLFDKHPVVIDKNIAKIIGLNEAIILQQVHYWIEINKKAKRNYEEGRFWTYNTIDEWKAEFPFWSKDTVKRTFKRLREIGLMVIGNFNRMQIDRTLWYTIDYERLDEIMKGDSNIHIDANCPNGEGQNAPMQEGNFTPTIPETSTEITPEIYNQSINREIKDNSQGTMHNSQLEKTIYNSQGTMHNAQLEKMIDNSQGTMHNAQLEKIIYNSQGTMHNSQLEKMIDNSQGTMHNSQLEDEKINSNSKDEEIDGLMEYEEIIKKCEIEAIDENYRTAVSHAIRLLLIELSSSTNIKIGNRNLPTSMVKKDMAKLNFFVIDYAVNKFKEASGNYEIRNPISYLKACICNAIYTMDIDVDAKLRNAGLI